MEKAGVQFWTQMAAALFLCAVSLFFKPAEVDAGAKIMPVEGAAYNVSLSLADNLKVFVGKKVYLTLDSGKTMAGFVKEVGVHLVHLEKLDGKDFYDALVRLEDIIAIDARFREYKR